METLKSPQIRMPSSFLRTTTMGVGGPDTFVYWDQFTFIDLFLQLLLNLSLRANGIAIGL